MGLLDRAQEAHDRPKDGLRLLPDQAVRGPRHADDPAIAQQSDDVVGVLRGNGTAGSNISQQQEHRTLDTREQLLGLVSRMRGLELDDGVEHGRVVLQKGVRLFVEDAVVVPEEFHQSHGAPGCSVADRHIPKRGRATLKIDAEVLRAVKVRAARLGKGDSDVIEDALRRDLGLDLLDRLWARNDVAEDKAIALALEAQHRTRA